jgi:hypothetical protein
LPAWTPLRAKGLRPRARNAIGPNGRRGTAAALALACAPGGCAAREPQVLRVGINAQPAYEFAHLAEVQGRFAREHVAVSYPPPPSAIARFLRAYDEPVSMMSTGQIDHPIPAADVLAANGSR